MSEATHTATTGGVNRDVDHDGAAVTRNRDDQSACAPSRAERSLLRHTDSTRIRPEADMSHQESRRIVSSIARSIASSDSDSRIRLNELLTSIRPSFMVMTIVHDPARELRSEKPAKQRTPNFAADRISEC